MIRKNLTVIGHATSYLRVRDFVSSVRLALGDYAPVVVQVPDVELSDLQSAHWREPNVHLLPASSTPGQVMSLIESEFVLSVPNTHVVGIIGAPLAAELLDENPEIDEIAGLAQGPGRQIDSACFSQIYQGSRGGIAITPIENTQITWKKRGNFAITSVDFAGGPIVVRRSSLLDHHAHGGSMAARALTQIGFTQKRKVLLFSGLHVLTAETGFSAFPASGEIEALPEDTYQRWRKAAIDEISVMHRGVVLRNDHLKTVSMFSQQRILAVDGRGVASPEPLGRYFSQTSNTIQVGPGFDVATFKKLIGQKNASAIDDFRGSVEGLTPAERRILNYIRRQSSLLPGPLISIVKRILTR